MGKFCWRYLSDIGKLERGRVNVSLDSLGVIAEALDVKKGIDVLH